MLKDDIRSEVKQAICNHFSLTDEQVNDDSHLWNDFEADDLAYIEIFMVLEERLDCSDFNCLEYEECRMSTVKSLIDHIYRVLNPGEDI
jgi:acyl carrier protein